jgi:tetratricopeptide (TPR) repeat protein
METQYRTGRALLMYPPRRQHAREYLERARRLASSGADNEQSADVAIYVQLSPVYEAWTQGDIRRATAVLAERCARSEGRPISLIALHSRCATWKVALGDLSGAEPHVAAIQRPVLKVLVAHFRGDREAVRRLYDSQIRHYPPSVIRSSWALRAGVADQGGDRAERLVFGLPEIGLRHLADLGFSPPPTVLEHVSRHWRMFVRPTPDLLDLAGAYARALEARGDVDRALMVLETATAARGTIRIEAAPWWVEKRFEYADLLYRSGRLAEAERVGHELLALLPDADQDFVIAQTLRKRYPALTVRAHTP